MNAKLGNCKSCSGRVSGLVFVGMIGIMGILPIIPIIPTKEQALLSLATKIVEDRGHHAGFAVQLARNVGITDGEIVEVIQLVTLSIFSNYLNNLAGTELDVSRADLTLAAERTA